MRQVGIPKMSVTAGDITLADPLTEGGDVTRPPGEGGDGDGGVSGPGEGGPEQVVVESVLASGVQTGPGAEAGTQASDPMEP
jgi:hypothetical protein